MKLLTTREAAAVIGVSVRRIRQFCEQGRIGTRFGDRWQIDEKEARAFARKQRHTGRPPKDE